MIHNLHDESGRFLSEGRLKATLGLPRKLPADFCMAPHQVGNVYVMVTYARGGRKHRVLAMCPECRYVVPAGRLHQHLDSKHCAERKAKEVGSLAATENL